MQFLGLICTACRAYKLSDPDRVPYEQERLTAINASSCSGKGSPDGVYLIM